MEKRIVRRTAPKQATESLTDVNPILARIYASRGVTSERELELGLQDLLPTTSMKGVDAAVDRIITALKQQQRILIVGDFDADGATSTALAVRALRQFGANYVDYLVPNRFDFGYGLTPEIVEVALANKQPELIITVDNGIASCDGVARANEVGISVIITDHHLAGDTLPQACAIVNPNQPGCAFASKNLAGVGVIFYVMLAVRARLKEMTWFQGAVPNMAQLLDLVALGTVADVVPLDHNNRILVKQGLRRIRAGRCCSGIASLLAVAKIREVKQLAASHLGFALGPRLNAAGRLDDMSLGIECLLSDDYEAALMMAEELDSLNRARREIEADMHNQALAALEKLQLNSNDQQLPCGMVLFDEHWHQGVIGILASRIKERLHRPVICFTKANEQEIKGSARSIKGLHIRDALDMVATNNPGLVSKFGGHAMAAGLTIAHDKLTDFAQAFNQVVSSNLAPKDLEHTLVTDGELLADDLSLDFAQLLSDSGPWGQSFDEPSFDGVFLLSKQRSIGNDASHNKLELTLTNGNKVEAVAFNSANWQWPALGQKLMAVYRLAVNHFRGQSELQLIVEHIGSCPQQP